MNDALQQEFDQLTAEKRVLESRVRTINTRLLELQPLLLEDFASSGVSSTTVTTTVAAPPLVVPTTAKMTNYIHTQLWAKPAEGRRMDLVAWLMAFRDSEDPQTQGLAEMTSVNTQSLSGWVRGLADANTPRRDDEDQAEYATRMLGLEYPEAIDLIELTLARDVRARKATN